MKRLVLISFLLLLTSVCLFPQTQLLRVGNAAQFFNDHGVEYLNLTVDTVIINGKEYFKIKNNYSPWVNPDYFQISYERIEGDSVHFILSSTNSDSLLFNFNWFPGEIVRSDTDGNYIRLETLDSIKIKTTFTFNDTIYYLGERWININTGDTMSVLPATTELSKNFGRLILGMWTAMNGVKINEVRYGSVLPYPEELKFSLDSIYVPTTMDTGSVFIVNNSDYDVRIDSVISAGGFYGYRGWFTLPQSELWFYLNRTLPNDWMDTLGIIISPHDSVKVSFYAVDLCPICYSDVQDYFIDTLRFVFTYNYYQNYEYDFSRSIQISGEGHPSSIEQADDNPSKFNLYQNYPNPFNPDTKIKFTIPSVGTSSVGTSLMKFPQFVQLKVYDILGKEVATLINEEKQAGFYEINFNASSVSRRISSGIYFYQLRAGSFIQTKKMILLR